MTDKNDSETTGPEIQNGPWQPSDGPWVKADLYTQSQRELEEAKQELAEVKRERDAIQTALDMTARVENEVCEERDRYREAVQVASSFIHQHHWRFNPPADKWPEGSWSHDAARVAYKLCQKALNTTEG